MESKLKYIIGGVLLFVVVFFGTIFYLSDNTTEAVETTEDIITDVINKTNIIINETESQIKEIINNSNTTLLRLENVSIN